MIQIISSITGSITSDTDNTLALTLSHSSLDGSIRLPL